MNLFDDLEKQARLDPRGRGIDENALQHFNFNSRLTSSSYLHNAASGRPEAMMKITSFARGASVRKLMEYIARTGKDEELTLEDETGIVIDGKTDIAEVHQHWSEDFERANTGQIKAQKEHEKKLAEWVENGRKGKKPRTPKGPPRHATHIILSAVAGNDEKTSRRVHDAARAVLRDKFGKAGYEYVFTVHKDTENPHVHVVVKNHNKELNKKLRMDKKDLFAFRQAFAQELEKRGIQQTATLRRDRPQTLENILAGVESVRERQTWFQSKINKKSSELNADSVVRQQTRKIQMIEKQLEKSIVPGKTRLQIKAELRELKRALIDTVGKNPEKAVSATMRALGKNAEIIETGLKEIAKTELQAQTKPVAAHEAERLKKNITEFGTRYLKEIQGAEEFIKNQKLPRKEKRPILAELKRRRAKLAELGIKPEKKRRRDFAR